MFEKSERLECLARQVSVHSPIDKVGGAKFFHKKKAIKNSRIIDKITNSSHLSCDSREIKDGSTFIAIKGGNVDGHSFISGLAHLNCLVLAEESHYQDLKSRIPTQVAMDILWVKDTRALAREYSPLFYQYPSRSLRLIGITGTNGKTTVSHYLASLYEGLGFTTGIIGTVGIRFKNKNRHNPNTTPEPVMLERTLADMRDEGVDVAILEISSHALKLGRVNGIELDSAIFTNITKEHLDFHRDMESYLKVKLQIFNLLNESSKSNKQVVLWRNIEYLNDIISHLNDLSFEYLSYNLSNKKETNYSLAKEEMYRLVGKIENLNLNSIDCKFSLKRRDNLSSSLTTLTQNLHPLIGEYNVLNLMAAMGELIGSGVYADYSHDINLKKMGQFVKENFGTIRVPGRVEAIKNNKGALVVVDYAHTADALKNVIASLKKLPHKKLITVFGCGGDRDKTKRHEMGHVAGLESDVVYITSDNPRTEDPMAIINTIYPSVVEAGTDCEIIVDRKIAIQKAVESIEKDDILLVAGKGHEDYQIIDHKKIPFDDREVVRQYLKKYS